MFFGSRPVGVTWQRLAGLKGPTPLKKKADDFKQKKREAQGKQNRDEAQLKELRGSGRFNGRRSTIE